MLCETPTVIAGHAFTTGKITRRSGERILPQTWVEFGIKDGLGCNAGHYLPAEMDGKIVPDEHIHEHATCFNVRDMGLVVISSCGHVGIVNSVKQAQEVSGIQKVHAIVGGFHLGPAPPDYLKQVVSEIKALEPDVLIPMHCSGLNFVQEATAQMARQGAGHHDRQPPLVRHMIVRAACCAGFGLWLMLAPACAADAPARSPAEIMDILMWNREPVGGPFELIDHTGHSAHRARFSRQADAGLFRLHLLPRHLPDRPAGDRPGARQTGQRMATPCSRCSSPSIPNATRAEHLAEYVPMFHPRLIGLTGGAEAIRKAADAYKVYYAKVSARQGCRRTTPSITPPSSI